MARRRLELDRPRPKTPYRVLVRNEQVLSDWEKLVRTRRGICIRLWDCIANTPTTPIGSRYLPLRGSQQWVLLPVPAHPL